MVTDQKNNKEMSRYRCNSMSLIVIGTATCRYSNSKDTAVRAIANTIAEDADRGNISIKLN